MRSEEQGVPGRRSPSAAEQVLARHQAPTWFTDAKLGIFVHWGLFSVPGWAPADAKPGVDSALKDFRTGTNAYAEWYENSLRVPDSPTARYHEETYGDAPYSDFAEPFGKALRDWDPAPWAELFAEAGARYVVLTTKHHDGYLLWPSAHPNPHRALWQTERDVVGDVAAAVRAKGLRFGAYYSGGYDWTFEPGPIDSFVDLFTTVPVGQDYARYVEAHYRELVERYRPSVLWNDIAMPTREGLFELLVDYLEAVPDGTVNDRFHAPDERVVRGLRVPALNEGANRLAELLAAYGVGGPRKSPSLRGRWSDFATPEYTSYDEPVRFAWETCRGVGKSFGYNRAEDDSHHLPVGELITSFVDVVSKGGNLLLNVGPDEGGDIPELQASRLRALGAWLQVNGEAIYGTRPWVRAGEGAVRFTQAGGALYVHLFETPSGSLQLSRVPDLGDVTLLGHGRVDAVRSGDGVRVTWPDGVEPSAVPVLRIGERQG